MPGDKKEKKKQKEEIKAFKKAFKKQTGLSADSKDWGKLLAAFETQVRELNKWTVILSKIQPDEVEDGQKRLQFWTDKLSVLQKSSKKDLEWAGKEARDKLPVLLKVIEAVRKKAKSKPVRQTVGERTLSVYITDIPGFADLTTREQKDAIEKAAQKTAHGFVVYDQIAKGAIDKTQPVDPDDVEALVWALKSKAQDKNRGPYQKGAMTVPNGEQLREYLDKCPQVYSRLSSHFREQQGRGVKGGIKITNKDGGQTPRGMDFYNPDGDDQPGSLPSGMNALLYQQVVLPNGEVALYVKMETEGSYGHPGDNRKIDPTVPPDRAKHPNDGKRARKHLKNLLIKEPGDKDLPGLREQTPKEVGEAMKAVVKAVEGKKAKAYLKSSYGTEVSTGILEKAVPRIAYFFDTVEDCKARADEDGWALGEAAEDLLDKLILVINTKFPADLLEGGRRMGEEVVLTDDDLAKEEEAPVEDDDYDDYEDALSQDDDEEEGVNRTELSQLCSDLVDAVKDDKLKEQLAAVYYGEILERGDDDSFKHLEKMVGKSEAEDLGPRASKLAELLEKAVQRL